jgi:hypothetical protein
MSTENTPTPGQNTGTPSSPKTNQDFNKKKPVHNDPELKKTPEELEEAEGKDLLDDESLDPGETDGNGNLIEERGEQEMFDDSDEDVTDEYEDNDIDMHTRQTGIKNTDAREL